MFKKRAYAAMLTYEVPDEEKNRAEKATRWFNYCLKVLKQCDEHLNLIYNPFKKNNNVSPDKIFESRAMLRNVRDKISDNFNNFKKIAFKSYVIMQPFTSDTQTEKVLKSFVNCVEDIEIQVNRLISLFDNLKSEDFGKGIVSAIENIKKEIAEFNQIVEDRVKMHIQTNILARTWVDSVSNELQEKVEKKSPLVMQLVEDRIKMLNQKKN